MSDFLNDEKVKQNNKSLYQMEQKRIEVYQELESHSGLSRVDDLGYMDMNTRALNLEKSTMTEQEWQNRLEEHKTNKRSIEEQWRRRTAEKKAELSGRGNGSPKSQAFYNDFSLKDMEIFMKNSYRGENKDNSDEYNSVVTDLELLNRAEETAMENEKVSLMLRLQQSSKAYLKSHKRFPWSTEGKIRRAMIATVERKVTLLLNTSITEMNTSAKSGYDTFKKEKTPENIEAATKAHFNYMFQILQGNVKVKENELKELDNRMAEILKELLTLPIDKNQNDTGSTRFFNALGWTSEKPKITDRDIEDLVYDAPLRKKLFHSITNYDPDGNAVPQAKQLAGIGEGKSRQYMSNGVYGKGTYLATNNDDIDAGDEVTEAHCWEYGDKKGSVQLEMVFNENARIVKEEQLDALAGVLKDKFPEVYSKLYRADSFRRGGKEYFSLIGAFFGYNVIFGSKGAQHVDYLQCFNRRALTISNTIKLRTDDGKFTAKYDRIQLKEGNNINE